MDMMNMINMKMTAKEELDGYNIKREYEAIKRYHDKNKSFQNKTQEARYKLLKYIITCTAHDPINGDYYDKENIKLIKEAGKLLYESTAGMNDPLFWSFVPRRYKREIDMFWDGIGDWKS